MTVRTGLLFISIFLAGFSAFGDGTKLLTVTMKDKFTPDTYKCTVLSLKIDKTDSNYCTAVAECNRLKPPMDFVTAHPRVRCTTKAHNVCNPDDCSYVGDSLPAAGASDKRGM